jgi:flagellar biosynthesis regulator FlbT
MSVKPAASYRKIRRVALLYDLDLFNKQTLIRVDLIIQSADSITTPVTPLYEAR